MSNYNKNGKNLMIDHKEREQLLQVLKSLNKRPM